MKTSRKQKTQQMVEGFIAVQKAIGTRKGGLFQKYGLSRSQVHILYALHHGRELTVKDIASKMGITSSAATQIIEGMVMTGFVERKQDQKDRRIVHVAFSETGKKRFDIFKNEHTEQIMETFSVLSDRELEALIAINRKIIGKLEEAHANHS